MGWKRERTEAVKDYSGRNNEGLNQGRGKAEGQAGQSVGWKAQDPRTEYGRWRKAEPTGLWFLSEWWSHLNLFITELLIPLLVSIFFIPSQWWFYLYSCLWQITWELFTSLSFTRHFWITGKSCLLPWKHIESDSFLAPLLLIPKPLSSQAS